MRSSLHIDTDAVRDLAAALDRAAAQADGWRGRILGLLVAAEIDDASAAALLRSVDDELTLVAAVLRARADQADYPLHDTVALTLARAAADASDALALVVGPLDAAVEQGRLAAREVRRAATGPPEALLHRIAAGAADPSFAYGFARELPPVGGAAVVLAASAAGRYGPDAAGAPRDERAAWGERQSLLLGALGQVYAAATRWTGSHGLEALSPAAWVAGVTADPARGAPYGQGAALALIAAHGTFGGGWLADVAGGVYEYERADAVGSAPLWQPRSQPGSAWAGPITPEGTRAFDPLASLLAALGATAIGAQRFFDAGGEVARTLGGVARPVSERLLYLLESRRWPVDDAAGLGAALEAATTEVRDRTADGRRSAELASQVVAVVGANTGDGAGGFWIFGDDGWRAPEGVRDALTTIVADYMPDVFLGLQVPAEAGPPAGWSSDANPLFPPLGPYGAVFRPTELAAVVETIGVDPERTRRLVAATLGTERLAFGHALDGLLAHDPELATVFFSASGGRGPPVSLVTVENAVSAAGRTLGFLVDHGYTGLRDAEARAAAARAHTSELLQVAIALPFVPTPTGPWGKLVVSRVTGAVFDAWQRAAPRTAAAAYGTLDEQVTAELRDLVLDDLLARGLLSPSLPIVGFEPPPAAALVRRADGAPVDPPRFDRTTAAYVAWAARYAPASWIHTQVDLLYLSQFRRVD